jgi:hypothetical protein
VNRFTCSETQEKVLIAFQNPSQAIAAKAPTTHPQSLIRPCAGFAGSNRWNSEGREARFNVLGAQRHRKEQPRRVPILPRKGGPLSFPFHVFRIGDSISVAGVFLREPASQGLRGGPKCASPIPGRREDRMNRNLIKRLEALEFRLDPGPAPKETIPRWLLEGWEGQLGINPDDLAPMAERVRRCFESSRKHSQPLA